MATFSVCLIVLILNCILIWARPSTTPNDGKLIEKLWLQNLKNTNKFRCSQPQPRAIAAYELLGSDLLSSEKVVPNSAVIYRCDSQSGCCPDHKQCGPKKLETVTLWFRTMDTLKNSHSFKKVSVNNHTECGCQNSYDEPKR